MPAMWCVRPSMPSTTNGQVLAQLVGQVYVQGAAYDGRFGRFVIALEAHGIAFTAVRAEGLLHGADNVAVMSLILGLKVSEAVCRARSSGRR